MKRCTPPWVESRFTSAWLFIGRAWLNCCMPLNVGSSWQRTQKLPPTSIIRCPPKSRLKGWEPWKRPRGTLTHHYWTDERGILTKVNLIVGTTNNYAPMTLSIKKAASSFIKHGTIVTEGLLNRVEMAFRAYDPCFGCATHSMPGQMPLEVTIRDSAGETVKVLSQYLD